MVETIYICDTVYQLIVASCIQKQINEKAALILTDHTRGMKELSLRVREFTSLFKEVFFVEAIKYSNRNDYSNEQLDEDITTFVQTNKLYDCKHILVGTLERYMRSLIKYFKCNLKKDNLYISIIEDGFSTYSFYGKEIKDYKYKENLEEVFLYDPSRLSWDPADIKISQISKKFFEDEDFVEELNKIFGYYKLKDTYSEKYIVLSSSAEEIAPIKNKDAVLKLLAKCVGKDNILIKTHPRMNRDYYIENGYHVNKDSCVPWEIVALNMDLSDKVIIGGLSGSIYTPKVLFDKKMTGITVMKILDYSDPFGLTDYYSSFLCKKYNCFFVPQNMEDFSQMLKEIK